MRISRLGGLLNTDTFGAQAEVIDIMYEADGSIPVGAAVMIDTASNLTGKLAVIATATNDHLCLGIYTGEGGTGALNTTSGLPTDRRAAVDGDVIFVRAYGAIDALTDDGGTGTDIAVADVLTVDNAADNGYLVDDGDSADVVGQCNFVALEAQAAGPTGTAVFVKCM